jgi:transposase IS4-like protein
VLQRLVSADRGDHAASIVNDFHATLSEALQYTATVTPAAFPTLMQGLDPRWIDEALATTGTATLRRRRLPADRAVWLVLGMAVLRDWSIATVVNHLELAMPTPEGVRTVAPARLSRRVLTAARIRRNLTVMSTEGLATGSVENRREVPCSRENSTDPDCCSAPSSVSRQNSTGSGCCSAGGSAQEGLRTYTSSARTSTSPIAAALPPPAHGRARDVHQPAGAARASAAATAAIAHEIKQPAVLRDPAWWQREYREALHAEHARVCAMRPWCGHVEPAAAWGEQLLGELLLEGSVETRGVERWSAAQRLAVHEDRATPDERIEDDLRSRHVLRS